MDQPDDLLPLPLSSRRDSWECDKCGAGLCVQLGHFPPSVCRCGGTLKFEGYCLCSWARRNSCEYHAAWNEDH